MTHIAGYPVQRRYSPEEMADRLPLEALLEKIELHRCRLMAIKGHASRRLLAYQSQLLANARLALVLKIGQGPQMERSKP